MPKLWAAIVRDLSDLSVVEKLLGGFLKLRAHSLQGAPWISIGDVWCDVTIQDYDDAVAISTASHIVVAADAAR